MVDTHERIKAVIDSLPVLAAPDLVDADDSCPICLMSFTSLLQDSAPDAGVTKLMACNHVFCRKEYAAYFNLWDWTHHSSAWYNGSKVGSVLITSTHISSIHKCLARKLPYMSAFLPGYTASLRFRRRVLRWWRIYTQRTGRV